MTSAQLYRLRRELFLAAVRDGTLETCRSVALELGRAVGVGTLAHHEWVSKDEPVIRIFVGEEWTQVLVDGLLTLDDRNAHGLFVPGEWIDRVRHFGAIAARQGAWLEEQREQEEKAKLLAELGMTEVQAQARYDALPEEAPL